MPKMSDGKALSTGVAAPAREVDVSPAKEVPKASSKRSIDAPTEQVDDPARRHKKVKVLVRRHKSRHDEGGSRFHCKGKEPAAPSEELATPVESDEGGASPARWRGLKNSTKVWNDSLAAEEFERGILHPQLVRELYTLPLSPSCQGDGFDEVLQRLEASKKELSEVRSNLVEIQRLLKEAQVRARKMDDELLQVVKALENARAELPRQVVDRYKESADFKEGLKRMGRVTYKYGYRVVGPLPCPTPGLGG
ncbi:hypothetical protein BHM03_00002872 [Ensete ventricosum]|uniref:Uncharacterized protein n=1 Tax=Ensete ventricosum TaxID=4639 RepID=A0A445M9T6_ENSVE|nr:hypothetical protein BHM03_00002872 [Ensete ventricosum]